MSWFFAVVGPAVQGLDRQRLAVVTEKPHSELSSSTFYLAAGGRRQTLHVGGDSQQGFCLVGLGLKMENGTCRLLTETDWQTLYDNFDPSLLSELNGHFALLRWRNGIGECYTDQLGLRPVYITCQDGQNTILSTRQDWLAKCSPNSRVDYQHFASQWLLVNSLNTKSTITGIERIGPGGRVKLSGGSYQISSKPWTPDTYTGYQAKTLSANLQILTAFLPKQKQPLTLMLSGGFDSRVLLAILLAEDKNYWQVSTHGEAGEADNRISKKLINELALPAEYHPFDDTTSTLKYSQLVDFVGITNGATPVALAPHLSFYADLRSRNMTIIDGGFGEIARRRYLTRLQLFGRKAVQHGDVTKILTYLQQPRADIFNPDMQVFLQRAAEADMTWHIEQMPRVESIGFANWLDLFAIRTRLVGGIAFEQSRIDAYIRNYMPFAQPVFLASLLRTFPEERRNAKFMRALLASYAALTNVPLQKDGVYYRHYYPTLFVSYLRMRNKKRWQQQVTGQQNTFLTKHREIILDLLNSRKNREYAPFDRRKTAMLSNAFTNRSGHNPEALIWYFTFALWRNEIEQHVRIFA
jgi:hypothetical protein